MQESIKIDSVFLSFNNRPILRGVCLEFQANKVTGILGRNGCGKSCFLKIITGQLHPRSKYFNYNNKVLLHLYKEKGLINYLPQHPFHPKSISLKGLLHFYKIEAAGFLQNYPFLAPYMSTKLSHLSGGESRLIEVLLVLESDTKFSILDEPFSHIMPKHIELVKTRIKELAARKGILLTDHQYRNVLDISNPLFILKDGILRGIKEEEDLRYYQYIR